MAWYIKWFVIALVGVIAGCNIWIISVTGSKVADSLEEIPISKVGLVLGTSNKVKGGGGNPFFTTRIEQAAALYHAGKVKHLLVSGDNQTVYYNEPKAMLEALVSKGVPEESITLDYAGFRTLDSIVRCKEIFGATNITIITQKFHAFRALFISQYYGLDAVAMPTNSMPVSITFKVWVREIIARPKAVLDLYILHMKPKFLGEKEYLE